MASSATRLSKLTASPYSSFMEIRLFADDVVECITVTKRKIARRLWMPRNYNPMRIMRWASSSKETYDGNDWANALFYNLWCVFNVKSSCLRSVKHYLLILVHLICFMCEARIRLKFCSIKKVSGKDRSSSANKALTGENDSDLQFSYVKWNIGHVTIEHFQPQLSLAWTHS